MRGRRLTAHLGRWQAGAAPTANGNEAGAHHHQDAAGGPGRHHAEAGGPAGGPAGDGAGAQELAAQQASRASSMQDTSDSARADAELEAAVLDTLTDSVLTGAFGCPETLTHPYSCWPEQCEMTAPMTTLEDNTHDPWSCAGAGGAVHRVRARQRMQRLGFKMLC